MQSLLRLAPNLTTIEIYYSNLLKISKWDLEGLAQLTCLNMSFNKIEHLPGDLFECTPYLKEIHFEHNRIKFIGEDILKPLRQLRVFNLLGNVNIAGCFDGSDELRKLQEIIKTHCQMKN